MIFKNREEAAYKLLKRLAAYKGKNPLVLALPRGAVPMAKIIAVGLQGDLGLILTRKISIPGYDEYAIGAVSESGIVYRNLEAGYLSIPENIFQMSLNRQMALMAERRKKYRLDELKQNIEGRIAILVDDGIATGSTVFAAIREARAHNPAKLIVAAAVAPPETAQRLSTELDELVLLDQPAYFHAVGQFFADFSEVSDQDVMNALWGSMSEKGKEVSPAVHVE